MFQPNPEDNYSRFEFTETSQQNSVVQPTEYAEETFADNQQDTSNNLPKVSSSESNVDDNLVEHIEEALDLTSDHGLLAQWMDDIAPFLAAGGKPVALILSLGVVSVPLLMSGSSLVAPILSIGAVIVAIIIAIRSYWSM